MSEPVVTVITPTWQRHDLLLDRCIPSVQAQGYPWTEHLVISDGPDDALSRELALAPLERGWRNVWYAYVPEHDPEAHYGHLARAYGTEIARGEYITYCDDDDALRPEHCHLLAAALDADPEAGFAVSRMESHGPGGSSVIGHGPVACGNVGTPMIMHRRGVLEHGTWDHAGQFEDWDLVLSWINAGVKYVRVDAETSDVWPSLFR
jgi:glycosyltransferase involved in cell wall biosynthesis